MNKVQKLCKMYGNYINYLDIVYIVNKSQRIILLNKLKYIFI